MNYFTFESPGNWLLILCGLLLIYLVLVFVMNRYRPAGDKATVVNAPQDLVRHLDNSIKVTIWNIGYAGLGKDSDFVTDGGKNWLPPSRKSVIQNLKAIRANLTNTSADILLLQEVSIQSPLSYWVKVRQTLRNTLPNSFAIFRPDISSWGLPWPLNINHGTLTFSNASPTKIDIIKLPAEPTFLGGFIKRNYALLVTRYSLANTKQQWVLINLHLAAFDPKGATRFKQLEAVMQFAQKEYASGNFVVMGGDWNMALAPSNFSHTTDLDKLIWLVNFPQKNLPTRWQIVTDKTFPTVRTNYQPYIKGQNYTAIIDGFIISPNVQVENVITTDTDFAHTDHHPVSATFSTKPHS